MKKLREFAQDRFFSCRQKMPKARPIVSQTIECGLSANFSIGLAQATPSNTCSSFEEPVNDIYLSINSPDKHAQQR